MAANPETAVAVIEPKDLVTYNLDQFPEDRYNRVIPTQTIRMPSDLLVPVIQVVQLDPADRDGKSADHYKSSDVPGGHRALTARGINKLVTAGAVSFYDERRMDDGADPDVMGVSVMASMILPTGQRITAPGSQLINIKTWFGSQTSDAEKAKFRKQFYAHTSTRARSRAARALLSLRASYPDRDIAKPFAVVSFAPNMDHPAVQERYLDTIAPRTAQLYGPEPAAQLGAGAPVTEVPEIDEDDRPTNGSAAAATDDDLPPFLRGEAADAPPSLHSRIRDTAAAGGMHGGAKPPQIESLQQIFAPLGGRATTAGLKALWPDLDINALSANQAQAVIGISRSYETPQAFQAAWRAMAGLE
jgi:hypothetical protein